MPVVQLDWPQIFATDADALHGQQVELTGFVALIAPGSRNNYFLLTAEPICCAACRPGDPLSTVEVLAASPVFDDGRAVRLRGIWHRLADDPTGWRYQLRAARPVTGAPAPLALGLSRRAMLASGAALSCVPIAACAPAATAEQSDARRAKAQQVLRQTVTVDLHSHGGRLLPGPLDAPPRPFEPLAAPMREGGMTAVCLAIAADQPVVKVLPEKRLSAVRAPEPGELYAWSRTAFDRLHRLVEAQKLVVVTDLATLRAAQGHQAAVIVTAEGADFLDGIVDRVDEAHAAYKLRQLQLTHYRVNELGDIQTEAPVVLSHTSLAERPVPRSRRISAEHARVAAGTGGVIGIWPPTPYFPDLPAFAQGMARMVDAAGIDHVGLGSDMMGLLSPSALPSYRKLPELAESLLGVGFNAEEVGKLLGGNYVRVFAATVG